MPARLLIPLLALFAFLSLSTCVYAGPAAPEPGPAGADRPTIGVLHSEPTLTAGGWRASWDLLGAENTFRRLGLECRPVRPADLETGAWTGDLLVLSDIRLIAPATLVAVRQHVARGGRLLATGQTSYRDHENRPWQSPGFALAELFGADFHRWSGLASEAGLALEEELGGGKVLLGRGEAMLVRPRPDSRVLARFLEPAGSAAILETRAGIYTGVSLLAPENSDSAEVTRLVGALLERILPEWRAPRILPAHTRVQPRIPFERVPETPQKTLVSVGLPPLRGEALVAAEGGVTWEGGKAREVRVQALATVGKPPAVALYDPQGSLLTRSERPIRLQGNPWLELVRLNPNGTYRWSAWRGDLHLRPDGGSIQLVNHLPLEEYLRGVVPNEMPAWFPPQALRAMAVVARSFTLAHLGRHRVHGFDLCSSVHCHVYQGLTSENPRVGEAIEQTRDLILTDQGQPLAATYHAVCGGVGEAPEAVWPGRKPARCLPGGPDTRQALKETDSLSDEVTLRRFLDSPPAAWCQGASRFRWEETWTLEELGPKVSEALPRLLGPQAPDLGPLRTLRVLARTAHGRVATLLLEGERASVRVHGDSVRWLLSGGKIGAGGLQSSLFYLDQSEGRVRFRGGGWGHGVGLCQEGAAGRARAGQGYREILQHYYPGACLSTLDEGREAKMGEVEDSRP
ncbi:MAG: SpoIID/LytB domain-containing protein [Candidatus Xenobium sp.]|nr:SpoIID/LytB domain-containing protein [Burkholderiales bacterium]